MSSNFNRIKKNIISAMQSANKQGTSAYDSVAEVRRVEGDTAWVHIAGGVDETPVKLTIAAKVGDVVQVRVGGGRAWITGNASAPPTDDKTAIVAKSLANIAGSQANVAQKTADNAQATADTAQDNALSATEATDALDDDFSNFKSNEYAEINNEVGGLVNYKDENEKVIANIKDELSQELVAKKFARVENGSLILGETDGTTAVLQNEQFGFYTPNSETPASYFGKDGDVWAFNIERGIVTNDLRFNGFQWISRANRNMSLKWLE